jgi:hypothetical protein
MYHMPAAENAGSTTATPTSDYPVTIRVDQGSEFVSRDMDLWAYAKGVTLDFSRWHRYYNEERPHGVIGKKVPDYVAELRWRRQPVVGCADSIVKELQRFQGAAFFWGLLDVLSRYSVYVLASTPE